MLSGLLLPVGLAIVALVLFVILLSGKKTQPATPGGQEPPPPAASLVDMFRPTPTPAPLSAREQDKIVQAELIAKWYAEAKDEEFKQFTLDDMAAKLAARAKA